MAYVFTASKASSVRQACKANFLATGSESLITVSSNTIYVNHPHTLTPTHEITCYGRISTITPFRYYGSKTEQLFVTTVDHKYFTLSYVDGHVVTSSTGDIETPGLSSPEMGHRVLANEHYIILYLFNGIVSVIPIHQAANAKKRAADGNRLIGAPQQVRLDELKIHSISLVDAPGASAVFGVLYRDMNLNTHFKTYELHPRKGDMELRKGPLAMNNLEHGTNIIISRGDGGVCCIGESTLYTVAADSAQMEFPISIPTLFNSVTKKTEGEWILGDDYGLLYTLSFSGDSPVLRQVPIPKDIDTGASTISIPHVLVTLEHELFLGSHYGDSQLLAFPSLDVLAHKTNMGPIQDILVEAPKGAGTSSSLITASGAYKDGALRLVKYGVGMADKAELEMQNVRGIWGLDELSIIVVAFVDSYIVLHVSNEGEIDQLDAGEGEIVYAAALHQKLVVIKRQEILVSSDGVTLDQKALKSVTSAKLFGQSLFLINDGNLESWSYDNDTLALEHSKSFDQEPSTFEVAYDTVIAGFWGDDKLWLGNLQLSDMIEEPLKTSSTPHSIILQHLTNMEHPSLFVAMSDGSLLTYSFDTTDRSLGNKKESMLGTTPVSLHVFKTRQGPNIFAVCDRPSIIHSSRSKIAFSNINIPSCTYFTAFNSTPLSSSIIVATDCGLRIGGIDDIQRLQFHSVPLGELPRRLVKCTDGLIGALTMRMEVEQVTGNETQKSFVKLFAAGTYEQTDQYELGENEMCQSICSFQQDDVKCIAVGSSYADEGQDECTRGRIVVFRIDEDNRTLHKAQEIQVPGSVYCLGSIDGGIYLVAGINSFVKLFECAVAAEAAQPQQAIREVSKFRSSTYALALAVRGDRVLVGDLMKSVTYLKVVSGQLEVIARDYVPTWMTAVQFCDGGGNSNNGNGDDVEAAREGETFLGAEAEGNMVLLAEHDSPLPENRMRLARVGEYRFGEMINRIVPGTFVTPEETTTTSTTTTIVRPHSIFGTVDGTIGCVGTIHRDHVNLLLQLQTNLGTCRPTVGGLSHAEYRGYKCTGSRHLEPLRFVDGDLVEEFLELTPEQQEKVCEGLGKSVSEIERLVESLARLK